MAEKYYAYYMAGLIGAFVGFLITWIENGKTLSTNDLIALLKSVQTEEATALLL